MEFGKEELEYDKSRGIYDYSMDKDNHGVTLHLKSPGSGIVYIEAGAPADAAEMVAITDIFQFCWQDWQLPVLLRVMR